jgi:hypothetical protein
MLAKKILRPVAKISGVVFIFFIIDILFYNYSAVDYLRFLLFQNYYREKFSDQANQLIPYIIIRERGGIASGVFYAFISDERHNLEKNSTQDQDFFGNPDLSGRILFNLYCINEKKRISNGIYRIVVSC